MKRIFVRKRNAQVSLEFVFLVGLVIFIVVLISPFIFKQVELNKALAAARDGAVYGASLRGMGYASESGRQTPEGIIKIIGIRYNVTGTVAPETGKILVEVFMDVRIPEYIKDDDKRAVGCTIRVKTRKYIYRAFSGEWSSGMNLCNVKYLKETSGSYYTFDVNYPNWV